MSDYGIGQVFGLLWPDFGALLRGELEGITALIVILILVISAAFLWYTAAERRKAIRRINRLREMLAGVTTDELVSRRGDLQDQAERSDDVVRHLWREFDETLVESPDRKSLWNTLDAEHFFNSQALAPPLMHNRLLTVVPSILTAIGVLGTFIGLTTGLNGMDLHTDSTVDELKTGIDHLIGGAAVAFMTSVWGVLFSLITNFTEKLMERDVANRISALQGLVDELFRRHAPEQSLVKIMDASEETSVAMQELHEKIGSKLQEAVEGISTDLQAALTSAIETAMAPSMERLAAETADQSSEVFEQLVGKFTASFQEIGSTQAQRIDAASEGLTAALDGLSGGVSEILQDLREGAEAQRAATAEQSAQLQEQIAQLTALTTRQVEVLDSSLGRVLEGLESASARITETTKNLARAATDLDSSAERISATSGDLSRALAQSLDALEEIKEQHESAAQLLTQHSSRLEALQATTLSAGESLSAAAASANEGFEALRNHQRQFVEELGNQVEGLGASMSRWLDEYGNRVIAQTNERMELWNEHSRSYADQMVTAVQALSEFIDDMGGNGRAVPTAARHN